MLTNDATEREGKSLKDMGYSKDEIKSKIKQKKPVVLLGFWMMFINVINLILSGLYA